MFTIENKWSFFRYRKLTSENMIHIFVFLTYVTYTVISCLEFYTELTFWGVSVNLEKITVKTLKLCSLLSTFS